MTDEEIKSLIRQYAVGSATKHFSAELIESIVMGFYNSRLKYDFCIVPKEQIYMRHGVARALMKQDPAHKEFYRGQSSVLECIFDKDMFEEEGK